MYINTINLKQKNTSPWLTLLAVFIIATSVRLLPFDYVFSEGKVFFFDGDSYLHIRQILLHIKNFPNFITFDFYGGYPEGTPAISPPLIDYILSLISITICIGDPTTRQVETISALIPPLIGGLTSVTVYFFARNIFNETIALTSSFLLAIIPAHIDFTLLGRPDNEMIEPLMSTLLFLSYIRIQNSDKEERQLFSLTIYSSIIAFTTLLLWRGATLWISLLALGIFFDIFYDFFNNKIISRRYTHGGFIFLLLSSYLFLFCFFNVWGNQNTFSFNIISWFHVTFFLSIAACIITLGSLFLFCDKKNLNKTKFILIIILSGIVVLISTLKMFPLLKDNIVSGFSIIGIGKLDPWIQSISEYKPLLSKETFNIYYPAKIFGWIFWLTPFVVACITYEAYKEDFNRAKLFFALTTIFIFLLAIFRQRFQHILAINISILTSYFLFQAQRIIIKKMCIKRGISAITTTVIITLLILFPVSSYLHALPSKSTGFNIKGYIYDAMIWLRNNTEAPYDPYDPMTRPPYSIMARWDFAGWIEYPAERPVIATLYGSEAYGLKESVAFHLSENEEEANKIMDATGARYFISTKTIGALSTYSDILGVPDNNYAKLIYDPNLGKKIYKFGNKFSNLVSTRLLLSDGIAKQLGNLQLKELDHYRLVYESDERLNIANGNVYDIKKLKIFEYLKGVSLMVAAKPGLEISVSSTVITNRGRRFKFFKKGTVGKEGDITFVLPYAKLERDGKTGLIEPYTVTSVNKSLTLEISDKDLTEAREFKIKM